MSTILQRNSADTDDLFTLQQPLTLEKLSGSVVPDELILSFYLVKVLSVLAIIHAD